MPSTAAAATSAYAKKVRELLLDLLDELKEEQVSIGHAGGDALSLAEIRWDLERLAMGNRSSELVLGVADEAALQAALHAAPGWRATNGGWQIEDSSALDRAEVLRQQLQERREAASAPVLPTRTLSSLTHLLRDSAYARVSIPHKLQQLAHLCAAELQGLDGAHSSMAVPYLSAYSASHRGAIDCGTWTLAHDTFPKGVSAPSAGQPGAARARVLDDASPEIDLQRDCPFFFD